MTTALLESYPREKRGRCPVIPQYGDSFSRGLGLGGHDRLDLAPNFYFYAIKSILLPIRRVQHDLVILYFQYIHPLFPLVDEYKFMETYRKFRGQEQYMDPSDFMVFQAVMAAGFGVSVTYITSFISYIANIVTSISARLNCTGRRIDLFMKGRKLNLIK